MKFDAVQIGSNHICPRTRKFCVVGIIVLAAVIRLPFALEPEITGDEANHVMQARCSAWDIATGAAPDASNPPLYMLLLHGIMLVSGNQVWVWKMMSVAMNLGMIYLIILLGRRFVGPDTALIAGFLAAINPWQVYMATELRMYAMVGLCSVAAIELAARFKDNGKIVWAVLWGLLCAAGFWTHFSMAVVALVTGFDTLVHIRHRLRAVITWCVTGTASLALMLLYIPFMLQQSINIGGGTTHVWALAGFPLVQCLGTTYLRPVFPLAWLSIGALAALVVFAPPLLAGVLSMWRQNQAALLFLLALLLTSVATPLVRSAAIGSLSFSHRYTFVASVSVFLLLACGLAGLGRRIRLAFLIGILVLSAISLAQFRWNYVARSGTSRLISRAKEAVNDEDALLVSDLVCAMRVRYYSNGGFPNCFMAPEEMCNPGKVEPGVTWADLHYQIEHPESFYTTSARKQLHTFKTVWYWSPVHASGETPAALGEAYQVRRVIALRPGNQPGMRRKIKLICYQRINSGYTDR
jgi:hypothetical protein